MPIAEAVVSWKHLLSDSECAELSFYHTLSLETRRRQRLQPLLCFDHVDTLRKLLMKFQP
jgi:hypothetical protein